jgi:hypothetical protein
VLEILFLFVRPGLSDWEDAGLLAQVLAASQQEYLDSLKKSREPMDKVDSITDNATNQYEKESDVGAESEKSGSNDNNTTVNNITAPAGHNNDAS